MLLVYLSLAYMIGVALGHGLWQTGLLGCGPPPRSWLLPLLATPVWLAWSQRHYRVALSPPMRWPAWAGFEPPTIGPPPGLALACLLCLLAGILRYANQPLFPCRGPQDLAAYNTPADQSYQASPVTLRGHVDRYPLRKNGRWELILQVDTLTLDDQTRPVRGRVRLTTAADGPFTYGQRLQVQGVLVEPPVFPDFDYRTYLAHKGIYSLLQRPQVTPIPRAPGGRAWLRAIYRLRARGETVLHSMLVEPYAALADGMLLGVEAGIPEELYARFNRTGTSHVIVISGSNVAVVAGVLMALAARLLGRRRALLPTLAGIGLYALLVGGDAAVVRAALMGGLFVLATGLGRRSTALVSLAVACGLMLLLDPRNLWDVGFQLSAAATAGLILFGARLDRAAQRLWRRCSRWAFGGSPTSRPAGPLPQVLWPQTVPGILREGLLLTLAANLTTLPLIVYHFGRLSLVSPLTNLLIAPAQPFIMLWGSGGLVLAGLGLRPLAQVALWIPQLCLMWTVAMVRWTADLPAAELHVPPIGLPGLALAYLTLGLTLVRPRLPRFRPTIPWAWLQDTGLALLAAAAALVWLAVAQSPDGRLHVIFLDVGQGDGIFIQTPGGRQVLVDGGHDPDRLFQELGAVMPFWDRELDLVIATHPDQDHMGAQVALPTRYRIDQAIQSQALADHPDSREWQAAMAQAGAPVVNQGQGGWIDLGDGVALWGVWPPAGEISLVGVAEDDKNDRSLVMVLVYGDLRLLLTGDAGRPAEAAMLARGAPVTASVLKVGHHGSRTSSDPAFIQAVGASLAVIQVGTNRYGHPHPEVLETLAGRAVLRTDQVGRIHLISDGHSLQVVTRHGGPWQPRSADRNEATPP